MASLATVQGLADDSDNEGTPTTWGDEAEDTDLDLVFDAADCAKVICKVHADRIREGAPGETQGHVISKWLVEQLDADKSQTTSAGVDGKSKKAAASASAPTRATITITVTPGMQKVAHKAVDYLYGKPLEESPDSAVHLLVLCRQLVVRAGSKQLRKYLLRVLTDKTAWRSSIVAIMMAALEYSVDTNDLASMLYDGCLSHIAARLSEFALDKLVALPLASLLEIMAHDDVDSRVTPDHQVAVVLGVMSKQRLPPTEDTTATATAAAAPPPPPAVTTDHNAKAGAAAAAAGGAGAGAGAGASAGTDSQALERAAFLFNPAGPLLTAAQFGQLVAHVDVVPPEHGLALLTWALAYKHAALIKACSDAVAKAFDDCPAEHMAGLPVHAVVEILSSDELVVETEEVVFEALLAYVGARREDVSAADLTKLWGCCRWRFLDMETLLVACEEETIPMRMLLQAMCAHEVGSSGLVRWLAMGGGSDACTPHHPSAARRLRPRESYKNDAAVEFFDDDSAILDLELCDASPLIEYLEPVTPSGQSWKLLYRGTRDGWKTSDFHSRCDGKGPTVVLVHSRGSDCVFGAYAGRSWDVRQKWQKDAAANSSFLFALKDSMGFAPCKMAHKAGDDQAMYGEDSFGPVFGGKRNDMVFGNPMNNVTGSYPYTNVTGHSYNLPPGAPKPYHMAGTTKLFVAAELEVFGLQ